MKIDSGDTEDFSYFLTNFSPFTRFKTYFSDDLYVKKIIL